jgi:hypothetical protein
VQKLIYCLLPDLPHFSLPSTFNELSPFSAQSGQNMADLSRRLLFTQPRLIYAAKLSAGRHHWLYLLVAVAMHGRMNYKDTKPYMSAFLSVDLLTDFAAFCLTDFIDWSTE